MLITLNYTIADFINNAKVLSVYRASSAYNEGKSSDDTNLTNNDESFLEKYLKLACAEMVGIFSGYAYEIYAADGVTALEPYEYDISVGTPAVAHQIVFRLVMQDALTVEDNSLIAQNVRLRNLYPVPPPFNKTALFLLDVMVKDALENFILFRTAKYRGIEFQSYQQDYKEALANVRSCLHKRTAPVVRNLNAF